MVEDILAQLRATDPGVLLEVVRADQRSATFQITDWSVRHLSYQGKGTPEALWLFSGLGYDGRGERAWAVVLKILTREEPEPAPSDWWYRKREYWVAQSGLTTRLAGHIKAPRFYRTEETETRVQVWMEFVQELQTGAWTLDDFAFAARQFGHWNGATFLAGELPDDKWLCRTPYRGWLVIVDLEKTWQFSLNQQHISSELRQRFEQLWAERERFFTVIEELPHLFSHYDSHRGNLLIRQSHDGQKELVAVDWAACGLGAMGYELVSFVGFGVYLMKWPVAQVCELEKVAFANYLQGLREAGWSGDEEMVRLAYVAGMAAFFGCSAPTLLSIWCKPEFTPRSLRFFGAAEEDLFWLWLPMVSYTLDCADEARRLMRKLGKG